MFLCQFFFQFLVLKNNCPNYYCSDWFYSEWSPLPASHTEYANELNHWIWFDSIWFGASAASVDGSYLNLATHMSAHMSSPSQTCIRHYEKCNQPIAGRRRSPRSRGGGGRRRDASPFTVYRRCRCWQRNQWCLLSPSIVANEQTPEEPTS